MELRRVCRAVAVGFIAWWVATPAFAGDLSIIDDDVYQVSACRYIVRFKVRYAGNATEPPVSYRIAVQSSARGTLLHTIDVANHKPGEDHQFAVPTEPLACDSSIDIHVDDRNQVAESNKQNNTVHKSWPAPSRTGSCAAIYDQCK